MDFYFASKCSSGSLRRGRVIAAHEVDRLGLLVGIHLSTKLENFLSWNYSSSFCYWLQSVLNYHSIDDKLLSFVVNFFRSQSCLSRIRMESERLSHYLIASYSGQKQIQPITNSSTHSLLCPENVFINDIVPQTHISNSIFDFWWSTLFGNRLAS
jgi:hypothetical protein